MTFYIVTMVGWGLQSARRPVFTSCLLTGCSSGRRDRGHIWLGSGAPPQLTVLHSSPLFSLRLARW